MNSALKNWKRSERNYDKEEFARIKEAAARIKAQADVLIVIGIVGGFIVIATYGSMFSMYDSM